MTEKGCVVLRCSVVHCKSAGYKEQTEKERVVPGHIMHQTIAQHLYVFSVNSCIIKLKMVSL